METKQYTLNKQWVKEEIKREIRIFLKMNENISYQNSWAIPYVIKQYTGKFTVVHCHHIY